MNRTKLGFFISVCILITGIINVNADTVTLVYPSNIPGGQMFDVNVIIDPNGTAITGVQLGLEFNKSSVLINSITEGNFLKQGGTSTIFSGGTISNSMGKAENIYGAILGHKNVTTSGTFIIINATAIISTGSSDMNLTNVLVVNPRGEQIYPIPTPSTSMAPGSGGVPEGGGSGVSSTENYSKLESREQEPELQNKGMNTSGSLPESSNKTLLVAAFAVIIIISILVYKYVLPKYSASRVDLPNIGKQKKVVGSTRKKISSIIHAEANNVDTKNIAADMKIGKSGVKKAWAHESKDEPMLIKKVGRKKKAVDKNTGKPAVEVQSGTG
jgi:hypothetical protein